jgi:hypothetical protein
MKTLKTSLNVKFSKPLIVCSLVCLIFLGVASGAAFVLNTVQTYSGACEKLDGFPGMLQQVGFVPSGTCKVDEGGDNGQRVDDGKHKKCKQGDCTVDGKKGTCVEVSSDRGDTMCTCKVKNESRDEDGDEGHEHGDAQPHK